jgi:hypothetical protein
MARCSAPDAILESPVRAGATVDSELGHLVCGSMEFSDEAVSGVEAEGVLPDVHP